MKIHYACKDINNFGDIVPVYVYKHLGIDLEWSTADEADIMAGGSILHYANENSTIIGCGFGSFDAECVRPKQILSVRGKLTRERLLELGIDCPEIYQDMVDFLPAMFNPVIEKKHKLGVLPHYVDYEFMCDVYKDTEVHVIDICSGVESVILQIKQCEHVLTSSLHGIIACQTYGISWEWFRHNELASPDFKFQDYFTRIGAEGLKPILL